MITPINELTCEEIQKIISPITSSLKLIDTRKMIINSFGSKVNKKEELAKIPTNIKSVLRDFTVDQALCICLIYFRDIFKIDNVNTEKDLSNTRYMEYLQKYFPDVDIETFVNAIPIEFKRSHQYDNSSNIRMCYSYLKEYAHYKDIYTLAEFEALYYSKSVLCKYVDVSYKDIDTCLTWVNKQVPDNMREHLQEMLSDKYTVGAVIVSIVKELIKQELLFIRIPGCCKDILKSYSKLRFQQVMKNYSLNHVSHYTACRNKVVAARINGKMYDHSALIEYLTSKMPLAILCEEGLEGIYYDKGELRIYTPIIKEV